MSKIIKLTVSPFTPPIEEACGLIFKIHLSYSDKHVTLLINPNIVDYTEKQENKNITISQNVFSYHTKDTKIIELNFTDKNTHIIDNVRIKLINISNTICEGKPYKSFEIFVEEIT